MGSAEWGVGSGSPCRRPLNGPYANPEPLVPSPQIPKSRNPLIPMNIYASAAVSLFLLVCAAGLMMLHVRSWRRDQEREMDAEETDYRRRQYFRRMQTSTMLGTLAVAVFVGQWVTRPPWLGLIYWGGVLLIVAWVGLLAVADMLATRHYFGRLRDEHLVERAKLQAELRRAKAAAGNGRDARDDAE